MHQLDQKGKSVKLQFSLANGVRSLRMDLPLTLNLCYVVNYD